MHDVLACPPKRLDVACGMRWTVPKQEFAQPDVPQCRINIVGVKITGLTREMLPKPQKFRHRAPPTHLAPVAQKSADGRRAAVVAFQVVPPARRTHFQSGHFMNLLSRFRIRSKLAGMVVLSAVAVCAIVAWSASLSKQRMLDDRIAQLRAAVDLVIGLAQSLQDEVGAGKLTLPEAQQQLRVRAR